MALFKRERGLRAVEATDPGFARVLVSLTVPPGPERESAIRAHLATATVDAVERFVYDGEDGSPAALVTLRPLHDATWEGFVGVDPVLRNFGVGEQVAQLALRRLAKLRARELRTYALDVEGVNFLATHDFEALEGVTLPPGALVAARRTL